MVAKVKYEGKGEDVTWKESKRGKGPQRTNKRIRNKGNESEKVVYKKPLPRNLKGGAALGKSATTGRKRNNAAVLLYATLVSWRGGGREERGAIRTIGLNPTQDRQQPLEYKRGSGKKTKKKRQIGVAAKKIKGTQNRPKLITYPPQSWGTKKTPGSEAKKGWKTTVSTGSGMGSGWFLALKWQGGKIGGAGGGRIKLRKQKCSNQSLVREMEKI